MKAGKQSITADNVQISSDVQQRWQLTPQTAAHVVTFLFLNRTTEILLKTEPHSWNFKPSTGETEKYSSESFCTPKESDSFFTHSHRVDRHLALFDIHPACLSSG
jgi:hypothetical protein